jgi:hypothetical protein
VTPGPSDVSDGAAEGTDARAGVPEEGDPDRPDVEVPAGGPGRIEPGIVTREGAVFVLLGALVAGSALLRLVTLV